MKAQDLKNSILQLAIQGKLVPQDANDEPAEVLYAKIQDEKQKLIKEGKIKKDKHLPPITDDEIPFEIPSTWKWVRLGDCATVYTGNSIPEDVKLRKYTGISEGYDYIGTKDVNFDKTINYENGVKIPYSEPKFKLAYKNSILMCIEGGSAGRKIAILDRTVCFGNKLCSISPIKISEIYILNILQSAYFRAIFNDNATGIIGGVSVNKFQELIIPLPPLTEQKRIVAKIEELEPLVKQYDKAETELSVLNDSFPEQLQKSILQYAIQGKLVPQDTNDEPAEVLYAKIQAEKQKLIKEGKIKKDKPLPPITDDEVPFEIPSTWKWVRLGDICKLERGKSKHRPRNDPKLFGGKYPFIQTGDVAKAQKYITSYNNTYSEMGLKQSVLFHKGTLCITIAANIGDVGILKIDACFPDSIVGLSIYNANVDVELIYFYFLYIKSSLEAFAPSTAQKNINLEILNKILFPLPPLAEQKRIVAKVTELMQYCEKLKS